jgi:hypothetical protein
MVFFQGCVLHVAILCIASVIVLKIENGVCVLGNKAPTNKNTDSEGRKRFFGSRSFYGWQLSAFQSSFKMQRQLVGQSFSALCASSLQYVSAISSLHSFSEAVLLFSLTLFGLISSQHRMHLL